MCNAINESNTNSEIVEHEVIDFNYDKYFKGKILKLPKCEHERPTQEIIRVGKIKNPYNNDKLIPLERHEYKTCYGCGGELVAVDRSRGEKVCDQCGMTNKRVMMTNDFVLQKQCSPEKLNDSKTTGYTPTEKRFLKSRKRKGLKTRTTKEDWRKAQHILTLGTISSQLFMTVLQINRVKRIIDDHSLHVIHSRVDQKITIAGICKYIMMKDGRGKGMGYNNSAFKFVGLNEFNYAVIKRNLDRLGVF